MRRGRIVLSCLVAALLAGCAVPPVSRTPPVPGPRPAPPETAPPAEVPADRPADISAIPDAVPRDEPRSRSGNPAFYEVFGRRYFVLGSPQGYRERGVASWYGPGFHAARTANGERYDMYAMSAAHKTLPLPAYVRVTNLGNGRSVLVRVNDRGPFKDERLIDLSYTAAAKLDMLKAGTALVEIEVVLPAGPGNAGAPPPVPAPDVAASGGLFVQAGAFASEANATQLANRLRGAGYAQAFVRRDSVNGRTLYRVRVGPIASVAAFDRAVAELKRVGVADARLALD